MTLFHHVLLSSLYLFTKKTICKKKKRKQQLKMLFYRYNTQEQLFSHKHKNRNVSVELEKKRNLKIKTNSTKMSQNLLTDKFNFINSKKSLLSKADTFFFKYKIKKTEIKVKTKNTKKV